MSDREPPLIAHIILRLDVGGMENGLVNLINSMPANRYRHAIVCLKDYSDFRSRISADDVSLYALGKKDGKDLGLYFRMWRLLRRIRPDIVHTRNLGTLDMQFPAALAGVRARVHGEHGWDMYDLHGANRKYRLLRRLSRLVVSRYLTVSADLRNWLVQSVGVPADTVTSICNGVDTRKFNPDRSAGVDLPFVGDGAMIVGTVGRLVRVKDQMTLAKAFVTLLGRESGLTSVARLVIVGDGPMRDDLHRYLADHGVLDRCWFSGARDDVADLLNCLDVFVLPSLNEGISNTVLEAMASGLPVVATDVGGNPELVADGVTGFLVPAGDVDALARALERYAGDRDMLATHGAAARERADREFSLERMVEKYMSVYDALTGRLTRRREAAT
jgi:sugar transferase (PEP-CTERM/EpsH1 system associated)